MDIAEISRLFFIIDGTSIGTVRDRMPTLFNAYLELRYDDGMARVITDAGKNGAMLGMLSSAEPNVYQDEARAFLAN